MRDMDEKLIKSDDKASDKLTIHEQRSYKGGKKRIINFDDQSLIPVKAEKEKLLSIYDAKYNNQADKFMEVGHDTWK